MQTHAVTSRTRSIAVATVLGVAILALAGCGERNRDKGASQTAAKVNKEEITIHQINYFLGQQRALPPDQVASSARQVLERLIDQELVLQKAAELKLDRDPRVTQQIEVSRRDVIVRAYVDKIGQGAAKPTPQEVAAYYEAHPALFSGRRIYNLQEVNIDANPQQAEAIKAGLAGARSFAEFVGFLRDNAYKYGGAESVRSAEQLPLADVDRYAAMKDGQSIVSPRPGGLHVVSLVASRQQPIAKEQATPVIEQFLLNERRRKLVGDDLQALRTGAKVEYVGQFAADAVANPYQPPPSTPEAPPVTTLTPTLPAAAVNAAPQVDVDRPSGAGSMPSSDTLDRGLKGLK